VRGKPLYKTASARVSWQNFIQRVASEVLQRFRGGEVSSSVREEERVWWI
jgi:hypothetical protein